MSTYFIYAIFPILLFFLAAVLVTGAPVAMALENYYRNRGRQSVVCPDSGQRADVEVDSTFAFMTAWRGQEHTRLQSCSRWPEKGECGQGCLTQLEPTPENIERLLSYWYEGKSCAVCARSLSRADWERSRLGLLNDRQQLFELRNIDPYDLQTTIEHMRPLCWICHQEERARQAVEYRPLKGDRHSLASLHDAV